MHNEPGQSGSGRSALVKLCRIATDYAGGYREGLVRAGALDELAAVSTDPDLLAHAAALHAVGDNWYAITAVDLLIEAGASWELVERYLNEPLPVDHSELIGPDDTTDRQPG